MQYQFFFYDSLAIILQVFSEHTPPNYMQFLRKKYSKIIKPQFKIYVQIFAINNNHKIKIEQWKFKPKNQMISPLPNFSNLQKSYEQENSYDNDSELSFSQLNQPTFFKTLENIRKNNQPKILLKKLQSEGHKNRKSLNQNSITINQNDGTNNNINGIKNEINFTGLLARPNLRDILSSKLKGYTLHEKKSQQSQKQASIQNVLIICEIKISQKELAQFENHNTFYFQVCEYECENFEVKLSLKYNYLQDQVIKEEIKEFKIIQESESGDFQLLIDESYERQREKQQRRKSQLKEMEQIDKLNNDLKQINKQLREIKQMNEIKQNKDSIKQLYKGCQHIELQLLNEIENIKQHQIKQKSNSHKKQKSSSLPKTIFHENIIEQNIDIETQIHEHRKYSEKIIEPNNINQNSIYIQIKKKKEFQEIEKLFNNIDFSAIQSSQLKSFTDYLL